MRDDRPPDLPRGRSRVARLVSRRPRWTLAIWAALLLAAIPAAEQVGGVLTAQPELTGESPALEVQSIIDERFPGAVDDETLVLLVDAAPDAQGAASNAAMQAAIDAVAAVPGVGSVRDLRDLWPAAATDGERLARVALTSTTIEDAKATVARIRAVAGDLDGVRIALAGGQATAAEIEALSERDAVRGELFGLPLSLVILAVAFGSIVSAALPLLVAIVTVTLTLALLFVIGQALPFAAFTQSIVTMLGLATGIDYALLMVSRFREELRNGRDPRDAAEATAASAGRAVAFSGATVVLALTALLVPPLPYIRSLGVGTIAVVAVSVLVSTTALPAVLALLGRSIDRLRLTRRRPGTRTRGFWGRRARQVMRRPRIYLLVGTAVLVGLALPAASMRVADPGPLGLAPTTESARVVAALDDVGLGGLLASLTVLVDTGPDGFFGARTPRDVAALVRDVESDPAVAAVVSPFRAPAIPTLFLYQYYVREDVARSSEVAPLVASTVGGEGRWVRLTVVPTRDLGPRDAADLVGRVEGHATDAGFTVRTGGSAVFEAEWSRALYASFPLAIAIVAVATFLLLGLAFRSLLIPLKSIVLNVLTVGAAYGVLTTVVQDGVGAGLLGMSGGLGFVDSNLPLVIFAIVFGLSMDYEVFLVSRIYEFHRAGESDAVAVERAVAATGSVITSAAGVMIVVFGVFLFSDVVLLASLGLGLLVAVLLDATLVRLALVPAVMTVAGRANWWLPQAVRRLADRMDLTH